MKKTNKVTALLVALVMIGCGGKSATVKDDHAHEESLQLTGYSDEFEIFAEATPFVVGHQSDILAHFTLLKDFKPLKTAKITMSLIVAGIDVRQTVEQPVKPGIYSFSLKPTAAGKGTVMFDIETSDGNYQVVVPQIEVFTDEHDAHSAAAAAAVVSSNGATFTKEQSWKVHFATEKISVEPFGQVIRATAQVLPAQGDERVVAAKAAGVVLFVADNITEGKAVSSGQSLFSIESSGLADNNMSVRFSEAAAEYSRAKAEFERKKELAKDRIVTQSDLAKAEAEYLTAEAVYNNMRKNFAGGKQLVSSPMGGFIKQVLVRNGEYAEAGQPVVVVSQNRDLLIKAELQPKYYPLLGGIVSANIRILNSDITYKLEELDGRVVSYGKASDLNNPLIPVVFQVKNSVGLLPGSFVEMFIKTQTSSQALTVPNNAIIEEMGNYFVYVQLTPEYFEKCPVVKGVTDGYRTEILDGIKDGVRVVSRGAMMVKLVQATGALDAHSGHVH